MLMNLLPTLSKELHYSKVLGWAFNVICKSSFQRLGRQRQELNEYGLHIKCLISQYVVCACVVGMKS